MPVSAPVITGLAAVSACGRGVDVLTEAVTAGRPAFGPVSRFDVSGRRVRRAAHLPGSPDLADELVGVIAKACEQADLSHVETPILLALHSDPRTSQITEKVVAGLGAGRVARVYTGACVASSTAVIDAAALIAGGSHARVIVAAGYLVEPDTYAVFDAGGALSRDGEVRPFSRDRHGLLLSDAVAAVVLESSSSAARRGASALAGIVGWGRAGDAYHVCRPIPDGTGLARAITSAIGRAGIDPGDVGYVNANATGSPLGDAAESAAVHLAFGELATRIPVSSTKSVHGHALEASALLELVVTVRALRDGNLPVNAGYLAADEDCRLDLVLEHPRAASPKYALSLNSAFGGANTALLVGAA